MGDVSLIFGILSFLGTIFLFANGIAVLLSPLAIISIILGIVSLKKKTSHSKSIWGITLSCINLAYSLFVLFYILKTRF